MKEEDKLDLGLVKVHKKAISEIAALAISEMEGVSLVQRGPLGKLLDYLPSDSLYGVQVHMDENAAISLKINLVVKYGLNIPDLSREIQDIVKTAIRRSLNLDLTSINLYIRGIERGEK